MPSRHRRQSYSATHTETGAEGGGWSAPHSGPLYPQERDLVNIAQVAVNILIRVVDSRHEVRLKHGVCQR